MVFQRKIRFIKKINRNSKEYIHSKGQYFTKNIILKEKVLEFIKNKPKLILEPSIGRGDLVDYVMKNMDKNMDVKFNMFEIDNKIQLLSGINKDNVEYNDFLKSKIDIRYTTIIGNPPYVKTKKGNLYIDFINKCYNLLKENGELIFVVPSDMFKLTSISKILENMMTNGTFTDIFFPNDETLFEHANIDVMVFRYCKDKTLEKKASINNKIKFITATNGLITFDDNYNDGYILKDYFNAYVGLVSGKEGIYKNKLGNLNILRSENCYEKYILVKKYPFGNNEIDEYLLKNKDILIKRKIRKFNEKNWFEWGAPRNIKIMENEKNKECIYVYTMTRSSKIAFKGVVNYYSANMIMLLPKNNNINIDKLIEYFNTTEFQNNFIYSGRFKIGHRILLNSKFDKSFVIN